jgi:hypothetical protein
MHLLKKPAPYLPPPHPPIQSLPSAFLQERSKAKKHMLLLTWKGSYVLAEK